MLKLFFLLLFSLSILTAKSVHFIEHKYYASLNKTLSKKGVITFSDKKTSIRYDKESKYIEYDGKYLFSHQGSKVKKVNLDSKPAVKMFFMLFESVYFNRTKALENYFTLQKKQGVTILLPKKSIARYINMMQYKKRKQKLLFLKINLANGDRIHIEEYK